MVVAVPHAAEVRPKGGLTNRLAEERLGFGRQKFAHRCQLEGLRTHLRPSQFGKRTGGQPAREPVASAMVADAPRADFGMHKQVIGG